ncbi:unnamed protein product [Rotaria socialis]|uniref:Phthiocerol/phthiodiolone dimycocerosyl transferase C-terminal domain-containing protein n=1 Tax=Rotaria socialis TaxID=392032 RepID=A0A818PF42_9BILA|nr:unnamed protein product [Rotaria socialis]CAF3623446.1 unnamed protein product [Rotaria socialis]CAF4421579.1 unnamed protein product [Rotaria socialis]CAF4445798.1 unnamed protein product [Rotaria socialis]
MFNWLWQNSPIVNSKQHALGPTANVFMKTSQLYQGSGRVGEILHLEGPCISLDQLKKVIARLQRRHPVLRSRLKVHPSNPNHFILEEDETLQLQVEEIPRKRHDCLDSWLQEWRKREKEPTNIGEGLVRVWLLQDPDDKDDLNGPREVVIMCEHCICDGLSLSNACHELLTILSDEDGNLFCDSLDWPISMEDAVWKSLSIINRYITLGRFIFSTVYTNITSKLGTARIPLGNIDFPVDDMDKHCHTELVYGILNKQMTAKFIAKCRQEKVTVTAAVISAILSAASSLIPTDSTQDTLLKIILGADTRRRCIPPIPSRDLSFHMSSMALFSVTTSTVPKTSDGLWQLARTVGHHVKKCIDAGQVLAFGMIQAKICEQSLGPIHFPQMPTYSISSWGLLPFVEYYGQWKLTRMSPFVNLVRGPLPFTTIQTVNGVLTMMFSGSNPLIASHTLAALRDRSMDSLQQMINN